MQFFRWHGTRLRERSVRAGDGGAALSAAQSAQLLTERGTGALRLVQAVNATHYLEVVTEGYLNVTTVYDKDEASGKYPAVHSRHLGILGQPVITHYQGFCEAKD